jgi:hypothetical protein
MRAILVLAAVVLAALAYTGKLSKPAGTPAVSAPVVTNVPQLDKQNYVTTRSCAPGGKNCTEVTNAKAPAKP